MARRFLNKSFNLFILLLKHIFIVLFLFISFWLLNYGIRIACFDGLEATFVGELPLYIIYVLPFILILYIIIEVLHYFLNQMLKINLRYWILSLCVYLIFALHFCEEVVQSIVLIVNQGIRMDKLREIHSSEIFLFFTGLIITFLLIIIHNVIFERKDRIEKNSQLRNT